MAQSGAVLQQQVRASGDDLSQPAEMPQGIRKQKTRLPVGF